MNTASSRGSTFASSIDVMAQAVRGGRRAWIRAHGAGAARLDQGPISSAAGPAWRLPHAQAGNPDLAGIAGVTGMRSAPSVPIARNAGQLRTTTGEGGDGRPAGRSFA